MTVSTAPRGVEDVEIPRYILPSSLGLSVVAVGFLFWLIYGEHGHRSFDASFLGGVNAALNAASACCLFAGYSAIRKGDWARHRNLMLGALTFSALFLVSYVIYHFFHGDSHFVGNATIRVFYLLILASHILLSMAALPLILVTAALSLTRRFSLHKRWARWTFPIWSYVSVTGVLVFALLKTFGQG
jgi:putative membrane protein